MHLFVSATLLLYVLRFSDGYRLNEHHQETHDQFDDLSFLEFDELAKLRRESLWKELSSKFGISEEKQAKHYQSFDILAPNIIIPSAKTTYWCSVHKLPDFTNKVSGVGFESHISPKSRDIIHHIEVFRCDVNDGEIPNYSGECESPDVPEKVSRCRRVLAAWAYGAKTLYYPENAGLTFFSSTKSQYVRLEIHYNNQNQREGVLDTSGIRFFYSNQIRPFAVGVLEIGIIYSKDMAIPPNQKSFLWPGVCPASCTEKALPASGINIFATQLHAHLTGKQLWTTHTRGSLELSELNRDNNYSTYNEKIVLEKPIQKILPGDELIMNCAFDTKGKRNITYGGMGLHGEMCVSYLHYYPDTKLEVCKSSVSLSALKSYFALQSIVQSTTNPVSTYDDVIWDPSAAERLQLLYQNAPLRVHCLKPNGNNWAGNWTNVEHFPLN